MKEPDQLRAVVDKAIRDAYDLGHTHGTNPWRSRPIKVNVGWLPIADRVLRALRSSRRRTTP